MIRGARGEQRDGRAAVLARSPRIGVWPPLPPGVWLRRPARRLPFPLEEPGCRLLAWGRHGLWRGATALGIGSGDGVLTPAYHHGSEVEALERTGARCSFYEGTPDLEPEEDELDALIDSGTRALHLTHFFGFPQDAARWRRFCDSRGLLLIEDGAQAWLAHRDGHPVGSHGDLAIFCLYKTFGLPEGATMLMRDPARSAPLDRRPGALALARKHAAWAAGRSATVTRLTEPFRRTSAFDPARDRSLRDPEAMPWSTTRFLLRRVADDGAATRRRANYGVLLDALGGSVSPGFRRLPPGASPFLLPVETIDKARMLEHLRRQGIEALDVWSSPHPSLPVERFPRTAVRRARTVGLPVHQELLPRDVDRMVSALSGYSGDGP